MESGNGTVVIDNSAASVRAAWRKVRELEEHIAKKEFEAMELYYQEREVERERERELELALRTRTALGALVGFVTCYGVFFFQS